MIYCDLIEKTEYFATYSFSCGEGEKGIISFPLRVQSSYIIKKQPEKKCSQIWLNKLFLKYISDFLKGIAKEKISYEC